MTRPEGIGPVRLVVLLGAVLLGALLLATPPQTRPAVSEASPAIEEQEALEVTLSVRPGHGSSLAPVESAPQAPLKPLATPESFNSTGRVYWTSESVDVHIGPGSAYAVIGLLPDGARLQIVGRDATSRWLGIVFAPYTGLTGWIEAATVAGDLDVSSLEVAPVTLLKLR